MDLMGMSFVGADFQKALLSSSTFDGCFFKKCLFGNTDLSHVWFKNSVFENTRKLAGKPGASCICNGCKVRCRCYCGGKMGCSFSFQHTVFDRCEFFSGEEFERHPIRFSRCEFHHCKLYINLYNVTAPDLILEDCLFQDCVIDVVYINPQQLDNRSASEFIRSCMHRCEVQSTVVSEVRNGEEAGTNTYSL
uniref:Uncharacterized protein n=1 Tax=Eutreptiella gymnastica TaxID=73025 RepID=A0A7S1NAF3_9EUGL|mmetsp:Transcript_142276/g.248073  ORF Transcript_142276/g.248073 Transcript_142276/m.248073 type:complete len:192 (+) Transcript_142276:1-576(+)